MEVIRLRLVLLAPLLLFAAGCGGGMAITTPPPLPQPSCVPASPPEFAYVLNGYNVLMYTVDSCTGDLTPTTPASVATGTTPQEPEAEDMVAASSGKFVYVANLVSNASDQATISMYTANSGTGVLTPTTPATVPTGFLPQGIAIDPSSKFVYTANSDDNTVSMFTVNPSTGVLTPATPPAVAAGWSPDGVTVHPSGKFVYAANQDDDTISMYSVNSTTGVLTPMTPATIPTGFSPFAITVDPSGKFAYVPDTYDQRNVLSQYTIDPTTGALTPNTPPTAGTGDQPTAIAVDPSSSFAYVVNRADNTVWTYAIDPATGNLTSRGNIATGSEPFRVAVDPTGKFVYVTDESGEVSIYAIGSDGTLTSAGAVITEGNAALSVAVTATQP
ncbi:MAG: beta-propeller fold lactonase family protein [Candidatus Acidiferrales bacterium]